MLLSWPVKIQPVRSLFKPLLRATRLDGILGGVARGEIFGKFPTGSPPVLRGTQGRSLGVLRLGSVELATQQLFHLG